MNLNGRLSFTGNVHGSMGAQLVADVEANPAGSPTQTLVSIRVGDVIYSIPTGGGGGGTSDYNALNNKPKVNNVTLSGDLTLADLGIQPAISFPGDGSKYLDGNGSFSTPASGVNYSTSEQDTGKKWLNEKPIYSKTIPFTNVSKSGTVSFNIANVDEIFLISAKCSNSSPIPYVHGSAPTNNVGGFFDISAYDCGWAFRSGNDAPATLSGFFIVEYTKTTD